MKDDEMSELFAGWFRDCENRLCPIALEMECGFYPGGSERCKAVWKEWLTARPAYRS